MGTISSSTGLMSGMDIEAIVAQLMQIEQRPKTLLEARIENVTKQQTALMGLQARLLSIQTAAAAFNKDSVFQQKSLISSDESVLTASATSLAIAGSYRFRVKQLASAHHLISQGYSSLDAGLGTGTVALEIGNGQLSRPTELNWINGQQGFTRGTIQITDRAGQTASVDLSAAVTVDDVLNSINAASGISVHASVSGDSIVVADTSGGTGAFSISGAPAESLGIAGNADPADPDRIVGSDLLYLSDGTRLTQLNDGNGIRGLGLSDDLVFRVDGGELFKVDLRDVMYETYGQPESATTLASLNGGQGVRLGAFRITDQNGNSVDIDLNELAALPEMQDRPLTLAHVDDFIQDKIAQRNETLTHDMAIEVNFDKRNSLNFVDKSQPAGAETDPDTGLPIPNTDPLTGEVIRKSSFIIEDLDGGHAAADLGIVDSVAGNNIHGERIWRMDTLGDLVNAVNNHWDNYDSTLPGENKRFVTLSITGDGLQLTHQAPGKAFSIDDTQAADDLGIVSSGFSGPLTGRRLISGLNTVLLRSLNGGSAGGDNRISSGGSLDITDRAGHSASLDLAAAQTLNDVLEAINDPSLGLNISAALNDAGTGIVITDSTDPADVTSNLIINDAAGSSLAAQLNLTADTAAASHDSGNLQLQYVSESSTLASLRQGRGIRLGTFNVSDSDGNTAKIDLTAAKTLADVIDIFSRNSSNVRARINSTGDGLELYDELSTAGQPIAVTEGNSQTAHDLNLLNPATLNDAGQYVIDGSYEYKFELGGGDTVDDFVARVNDADIGIKLALVNDGSSSNPYRISFTSEVTGRQGMIHLDPGQTNLNLRTLSNAQDAIVLFGDGDENNALLLASSSNTLKDVVKGTTLELHAASDEPVQLEVKPDLDGIVNNIKSFVEGFNKAMQEIDQLAKFNPETLERGILFSDRSVRQVRDALADLVTRSASGFSGQYRSLSSIGVKMAAISFESGRNEQGEMNNFAVAGPPQLEFNEEAFRDAYATSPQAVEDLFTRETSGLGDYISQRLEDLAGTSDSSIKSRLDAMASQKKMFNSRIDSLSKLLEQKEARLYNQFYAMEQALASMQSQQASLSNLSNLAASMKK